MTEFNPTLPPLPPPPPGGKKTPTFTHFFADKKKKKNFLFKPVQKNTIGGGGGARLRDSIFQYVPTNAVSAMSDVFYLAMVVCGGGRGKEQMCGCCLINAWAVLVGGCVKMGRSGARTTQPPTAACKSESSVGTCARCTHGFFFCTFRADLHAQSPLIKQNFLRRSSVRSFVKRALLVGPVCVCVCVCGGATRA